MEQQKSTLDLVKHELQNFEHQHEDQNQRLEAASSCNANVLVEKLIQIVQNEKEETEKETSPEEKVMSNSVAVRKILSYMSAQNLLRLREVSRLWREEATSILLSPRHEEFLCVRFEWWLYRREFSSENCRSLSNFMEIVQHSDIFPCSQFIFTGGQINEPTLLQFFSDFGSHVQHLGLFPESATPPLEMAPLVNIIFKWTPNLKSLALKQNLLEIEEAEGQNQKEDYQISISLLPNLRKLILPELKPEPRSTDPRPQSLLLKQILTSAPNLTSIEDPHLAFIPQITSAGKLSSVKTLSWNFSSPSPFLDNNFVQFAAAGGQLRSLTLEAARTIGNQTILDALRSLLRSSQNFLEEVKGVEELGRILDPSYKLSPLSKVTELDLRAHGPPDARILPQGNALSNVFPNLKEIHLQVDGSGIYPLTSPLNAHSGLKKVKISPWDLNSEYRFMFNLVEPLASLYPKLSSLHLALHKMGVGKLPDGLAMIPWCMEWLKEITIEFRIRENTPFKFKRDMDHALSGLPWQVCEQLWSSLEPNPEYQKLEVLDGIRIAPSIFDMKNLTNLTFVVNFEKNPQPIWTHVAEFYAFQPIAQRQGLKVNIRGSQNQSVLFNGSDLRPLKNFEY